MRVVVSIPNRDPHPVGWWRELATATLNHVLTHTGRTRSGALHVTIGHGREATITAWCETRPGR